MRRREFITLLSGAARRLARAQQQMPVVSVLNGQSPHDFAHLVKAFGEGLFESGYVEDCNVSRTMRSSSEPHRPASLSHGSEGVG